MPCAEDLVFITVNIVNGVPQFFILHDSLMKFLTEFSKTTVTGHRASGPSNKLRIVCQRMSSGINLSIHFYSGPSADLVLDILASKIEQNEYKIIYQHNDLDKYSKTYIYTTPDEPVFKIIDNLLNVMYQSFLLVNSNSQNAEQQLTQKIQQSPSPVVQSGVETLTKPAISPQEFYSKEFTVKHLEYYIPNEFRELVKKYGVEGNTTNILRAIDLKSKICCVMLRKTKTKSILRLNKKDNTKLILKIGTGDRLITSLSDKFEWREPHTEENIQHIKDAFIELNKWYKEKKEIHNK